MSSWAFCSALYIQFRTASGVVTWIKYQWCTVMGWHPWSYFRQINYFVGVVIFGVFFSAPWTQTWTYFEWHIIMFVWPDNWSILPLISALLEQVQLHTWINVPPFAAINYPHHRRIHWLQLAHMHSFTHASSRKKKVATTDLHVTVLAELTGSTAVHSPVIFLLHVKARLLACSQV